MSATRSTGSTARRYESITPTVGVEEEFILVDATSWLPSTDNAADTKIASTLGLDLQLELSRCQVETISPVCQGIDELRTPLIDMRRLAGEAAELDGCRLLAVGSRRTAFGAFAFRAKRLASAVATPIPVSTKEPTQTSRVGGRFNGPGGPSSDRRRTSRPPRTSTPRSR
ncbi:glutamate-cysteine ligase family protein [Rhodococcus erythropolis]|uniref:glutamate-cysteine ligase family protein n=1 Tax=Rhodococcus erythropolis TaxID=1833 RepID=UPI002948FEF3|nr:glutamate-cysteine ligase family protein [Rhodococcus erythropolis]MDV6271916.1 glutamate-cysteine ligase family protein [Rhodococcus erythropolis]